MITNLIPQGFKDEVSYKASSEHKYINKIIDHFQLNGFELVKTPLIEYSNKNIDKDVFKILVNKKEKKLNIRDDITLQVARLSQTRLSKKVKPIRLCYYGEVLRKRGTMLRPERQFLQIGAECIGEKNYLADVEMIELAYTSLNLVGIKNVTIEISSRVFYDKFIGKVKNFKNINEIKRLIKLKDLKRLLKIIDKKYHKYITDIFSCTGEYKAKKNNLKNLKLDELSSKEVLNIENIIKVFLRRNKKVSIFLDLCEIDNKNYHSGIRFTFFAQDVRGEIARGGRYFIDNSIEESSATGFTCYMDTIIRASSEKFVQNKILIPFDTNSSRKNNLIKKGYTVVKYTGALVINKKIVKDQDCEFYLDNNTIKRL